MSLRRSLAENLGVFFEMGIFGAASSIRGIKSAFHGIKSAIDAGFRACENGREKIGKKGEKKGKIKIFKMKRSLKEGEGVENSLSFFSWKCGKPHKALDSSC